MTQMYMYVPNSYNLCNWLWHSMFLIWDLKIIHLITLDVHGVFAGFIIAAFSFMLSLSCLFIRLEALVEMLWLICLDLYVRTCMI